MVSWIKWYLKSNIVIVCTRFGYAEVDLDQFGGLELKENKKESFEELSEIE